MECQVKECDRSCNTMWYVLPDAKTIFTEYEIKVICGECLNNFLEEDSTLDDKLIIRYSAKTIRGK